MKNFVGVCVADPAEEPRIGERSLQRAVFDSEHFAERFEIGGEYVDASGIECSQCFFAGNDLQRRAPLAAGFGEDQRSTGEVEGGEILPSAKFGADGSPVQAAGDHEVQDEPEFVFKAEGNTFANSPQLANDLSLDRPKRWLGCAQQEWTRDANTRQPLSDDARAQRRQDRLRCRAVQARISACLWDGRMANFAGVAPPTMSESPGFPKRENPVVQALSGAPLKNSSELWKTLWKTAPIVLVALFFQLFTHFAQ